VSLTDAERSNLDVFEAHYAPGDEFAIAVRATARPQVSP
jgi:hypothetical protein